MNKHLETIKREMMNLQAENQEATMLVLVNDGEGVLFGAAGRPVNIAAMVAAGMSKDADVAKILQAAVLAFTAASEAGKSNESKTVAEEEKKD